VLYRKAAESGIAEAEARLGSAYANGRGVATNLTEAVQWNRKAADAGDPRGQVKPRICL